MGGNSPERKVGCGLITVFGRHSSRSRKSVSACSSPIANIFEKSPSNNQDSKQRHGGFNDAISVGEASHNDITNSSSHFVFNPQKPTHVVSQRKQKHSNETIRKGPSPTLGNISQGRRVPNEVVDISSELESMINDHLKSKGGSTLVRASSNNVMFYGNLGNLKQGGAGSDYNSSMDYYSCNEGYTNHTLGCEYDNSINRKEAKSSKEQSGSLCRALSTRIDPEQLKIMGNEDYKNGRFVEALALYDAAIAIDPNKASYRSNRSAALTALGRLLEAVFECREAIKIESHYHRAHHRSGNLYFRLGEIDNAMYHYKQAGPEADPDEIAKVKILHIHLNKCTDAHRLGDWNTLITETNNVISLGADSAPQIYALQAKALLKLRKHQDADKVMSKCPKFDVDECTKFFGPIGNANFLVTRAQVDLAVGRFEDALEAAQKATRLDSNNKEANKVMRKVRAITIARAKGNELFKASKFSEACITYAEGLDDDPYNSVLLCNRAACRSKLGKFEKAIDDCTAALNLRPSYSKARLRRADCNAKLQRWEASMQDYEILLKETPEDKEVKRAFLEAQAQLMKQTR
ncbi:Inactive TPR repeat-containing thioredoxin TTL3, partial [Mucuna pruriens]